MAYPQSPDSIELDQRQGCAGHNWQHHLARSQHHCGSLALLHTYQELAFAVADGEGADGEGADGGGDGAEADEILVVLAGVLQTSKCGLLHLPSAAPNAAGGDAAAECAVVAVAGEGAVVSDVAIAAADAAAAAATHVDENPLAFPPRD